MEADKDNTKRRGKKERWGGGDYEQSLWWTEEQGGKFIS